MKGKQPSPGSLAAFEAVQIGDKIGKFELIEKCGQVWKMKCSCGEIEEHARSNMRSKNGRKRCKKCVAEWNDKRRSARYAIKDGPHEASTLAAWVYRLAFCRAWKTNEIEGAKT